VMARTKNVVGVRHLTKHLDDRGWLMEILRGDEPEFFNDEHPFGQLYCTTIRPGVVKAWHRHQKQTDRICCVSGRIKLVLYTEEEGAKEFFIGDEAPCTVMFPPGVWHGFQNVGDSEALVLNMPDVPHDHSDPDEERCPWDSLPYDWAVRNR